MDSTVTVPFEMTFRQVDHYKQEPKPFNMCGCGMTYNFYSYL